MPNALLVYPKFPPSFWDMRNALKMVDKEASMPPLGLLTIDPMFPADYTRVLVDENVEKLTDGHLRWADVVFVSAMIVQAEPMKIIMQRCEDFDVPVVAGGPYPTTYFDQLPGINILPGEVEDTFANFLEEESVYGFRRNVIYDPPTKKPSMESSPTPNFSLVDLRKYDSACVQLVRGCPHDCDFCDITKLFGRNPRYKANHQIVAELQVLYDLGWRGRVFFVDDNFIGNRSTAMKVLPDIIKWQKEHKRPFDLYTESTVLLARYPDLLELMVEAGFYKVFLGIETINPEALKKAKKLQNIDKKQGEEYLLDCVKTIQGFGLEVSAGFILGMDSETTEVFDLQVEFIQKAGIPTAMAGLMGAVRGTDLYIRLESEGRILKETFGNNVDCLLNFVPEMNPDILIAGYKSVLSRIYDPSLKNYFERCLVMFDNMGEKRKSVVRVGPAEVRAFFRSMRDQLFSRQGPEYVKYLTQVLIRYPHLFGDAVEQAIIGYHLEKVTARVVRGY